MSSNEENGKSEKRLMSIGEVSKAIGITRRIILNYEAKGLLLPDKKEGTAGNRYYTPDSISLIRSICPWMRSPPIIMDPRIWNH